MESANLLQLSLNQYRDLLDRLDAIARMLTKGQAADIVEPLRDWVRMQDEARLTDGQIADLLSANPETALPSSLLEEKQTLLNNLAARCREVFSQAEAHKALVRNELMELRGGRTAISGYRTHASKSGNSVSSRQ